MKRGPIGLFAAVAIAGCSAGGDHERASPSRGAESAAAAVIVRLDGDLRAGRYDDVCDALFSPRARREAGGARCARALQAQTVGVTQPRVQLSSVRVRGGTARAAVRVTSADRPAADQTIVLVRAGTTFKIAGLSG